MSALTYVCLLDCRTILEGGEKQMKKLIKGNSASGFTLIELLIVIVIIGILAGVLIGVIDPTAQQNKARDANVKAAISKVALATQGYISAYGAAPNDSQFFGQMTANVITSPNATCASGTDSICDYTITGNNLPATCAAANGFTGTGTGQCLYRYESPAAGQFTIYAKSFGVANTVFRYQNFGTGAGQIQHCDNANPPANCVTP